MRAWSCSRCGAHHDRDVNAAVNIRNRGVEAWWLDRSSGEKYSAAGEAKASESAVNEGRALHVLRPGMAVQ
jgi:hypothetical protein